MKVLIDSNNVVICKGNITDLGDNDFMVDNCLYGKNLNLTMIETSYTDEEIIPQRDKLVGGVKAVNHTHQNWIEGEKEKAREEIRQEVRAADLLGSISDNARNKLIEKGILLI